MKSLTLVPMVLAALATAATSQVDAYLVDSNLDQLFSVDLSTGAATPIASTANNGLGTPADLTWKASTNELWTIDLSGGEVGTIDTSTGVFTPVYQSGLSGWQGCAWDETTQKFYLANQNGNNYVLDPASGATTLLGSAGFGLITALDVDASGTLWGVDVSGGALVTIDKTTGAGTQVMISRSGFQGLGIDQLNGTIYGSNTNDDSLYILDPVAATTTLVGAHGAGVVFAKGFDLVDSPCSGSVLRRGVGCRDASGAQLAMVFSGYPCLGQSLNLGTSSGSASFILVMGASDRVWLGLVLPLDLTPFGAPGCSLYTSQDLLSGPHQAGAQLSIPVPQDPFLAGAASYWQGFVFDPAIPTALPMASSDMLAITVGQ